MPIDFTKVSSDQRIKVALGPTSTVSGVQNVGEPTAPELNNTNGTSGMIPASQSISWNDYDFGMQASESSSEPSLADSSTYEEFGQSNYGGQMSFYLPDDYDDNSNLHSVIYDLTDEPGSRVDVATRIDGGVEVDEPFADGDFVSVYRARGDSETNPFTPGESKRRTVSFNSAGDFAYNIVVGDHEIEIIAPATVEVGGSGRIRASQQGRDVTGYLTARTSNGSVLDVYQGGFFEALSEGTATITFSDPKTSDTATATVTVGSGE